MTKPTVIGLLDSTKKARQDDVIEVSEPTNIFIFSFFMNG